MGSEATRDLSRTSDFEEIVIADADLERAQALATELGGGRVRAIQVDANDEAALTNSLRGFDVVANCTTYHFGLIVTRAAINAQVNYLDLGGLYNTPRQLEMDEDARRAGVTICLGAGATPGVTNLMARAAADQLDQVDEVHIAFASFRSIAPSPGLLDTVLDEFSPSSRRFFWQAGDFIETPAFSGAKHVRFAAPVGEIETFYVPHSETHTIHRFLGKGVHLVDVVHQRRQLLDHEPAQLLLAPRRPRRLAQPLEQRHVYAGQIRAGGLAPVLCVLRLVGLLSRRHRFPPSLIRTSIASCLQMDLRLVHRVRCASNSIA
jgi:hypothetical protein